MSALDSIKKGVLNILAPWEGVSEVTLEHLKNGFIEYIKSFEGLDEISDWSNYFAVRGAVFGMGLGLRSGNPYVVGALTVLGGVIGAIGGGLLKATEVGGYGGVGAAAEVMRAQEKIKELNNHRQKEIIESKLEYQRKAHGPYYYQLGQIHYQGTHTANLHIIKDIGYKYGWKSIYYPGQYSSYDDMVNQLNIWRSQLGYDYDSLEAYNYK
ncbi:hypothetical protein Trichorick_01065 [Candidatus Trichorickettsia mobilis]|uniref:Uncharacterized protein n=1 Tax=Candidatus Trichorickettsia mobilis TaxID=1346319 RepID=A0ABZ0UTP4_9RICK|nr:hypothetical protein [Candidatus Trichorickettsia mobilis]WPY01161.1 hypothetical protein Trichorick_01065 [Candidatus Trichorickettsia mobilis]